MVQTIHWQLPDGAFYGTEQGRPLDPVLDDYLAEGDPSVLWHVTGPQTHYLFRDEAPARAYAEAANAADRAYAEEFPQAWDAPGAGTRFSAWSQDGEYGRQWEARRQARLRAGFEAACVAARRMFDHPGKRWVIGATRWTDFLNAAARRYGVRYGLLTEGV